MYFRQLNVKRKQYLFVRWNKEQLENETGMDFEHIRTGSTDGGWDYHYGNNKMSFKLELLYGN